MLLMPKNWAVFQHYKDRCPPWIKLHRDLLIDRDFMRLPLASKALAPLLWLLASEHKEGIFDASIEELGFRLHITDKEYDQGLKPLIDKGFFIIASGVLASSKQVAIPERETEGETETEGKKETKRKISATVVACPPDVKEQVWTDWQILRKMKKAPVTQTVVDSAKKEAEKAKMSFNDFLIVWCRRGSQGLEADWLKSHEKQSFAQINADVARTTVPVNRDYEATQRRLEAEASIQRSGPSLEVLAKMAAIRNSAKENHE